MSSQPVSPSRPPLRSLHSGPPLIPSPPELDPRTVKIQQELTASRVIQDQLVAQLKSLRDVSYRVQEEDASSELSLLRKSLEMMASALANEKEKRELEEKKVMSLSTAVEESRKALGRLQTESRRGSTTTSVASNLSRRSSLNVVLNSIAGPSDNSPTRVSSLINTESKAEAARRSLSDSPLTLKEINSGRSNLSIVVPTIQRSNLGSLNISGSRSAGLFNTAFDFSAESEKRRESRDSTSAGMQVLNSSITEEGLSNQRGLFSDALPSHTHGILSPSLSLDLPSTPPSAPLRTLGRNHSFAVFDDVSTLSNSRRGSRSSTISDSNTRSFVGSNYMPNRERNEIALTVEEENSKLALQLAGLKIRLAESEESRRASEMCVQALRRFISTEGASEELASAKGNGLGVSLPPLPTDEEADHELDGVKTDQPTNRWGIRLPSMSRRESTATIGISSPNLSSWKPRRSDSTVSTSSTATFQESTASEHRLESTAQPIVSASAFGSFSFHNLISSANPTSTSAERSPRMKTPPHSPSIKVSSVMSITSPLSTHSGDDSDTAPPSLSFTSPNSSETSSPTTSLGSSTFPSFEHMIEEADTKPRVEEVVNLSSEV